jgi:hypothetical protein
MRLCSAVTVTVTATDSLFRVLLSQLGKRGPHFHYRILLYCESQKSWRGPFYNLLSSNTVYANLMILTSRVFYCHPFNLSIRGPATKRLEVLVFPPSVLVKPETYNSLVFASRQCFVEPAALPRPETVKDKDFCVIGVAGGHREYASMNILRLALDSLADGQRGLGYPFLWHCLVAVRARWKGRVEVTVKPQKGLKSEKVPRVADKRYVIACARGRREPDVSQLSVKKVRAEVTEKDEHDVDSIQSDLKSSSPNDTEVTRKEEHEESIRNGPKSPSPNDSSPSLEAIESVRRIRIPVSSVKSLIPRPSRKPIQLNSTKGTTLDMQPAIVISKKRSALENYDPLKRRKLTEKPVRERITCRLPRRQQSSPRRSKKCTLPIVGPLARSDKSPTTSQRSHRSSTQHHLVAVPSSNDSGEKKEGIVIQVFMFPASDTSAAATDREEPGSFIQPLAADDKPTEISGQMNDQPAITTPPSRASDTSAATIQDNRQSCSDHCNPEDDVSETHIAIPQQITAIQASPSVASIVSRATLPFGIPRARPGCGRLRLSLKDLTARLLLARQRALVSDYHRLWTIKLIQTLQSGQKLYHAYFDGQLIEGIRLIQLDLTGTEENPRKKLCAYGCVRRNVHQWLSNVEYCDNLAWLILRRQKEHQAPSIRLGPKCEKFPAALTCDNRDSFFEERDFSALGGVDVYFKCQIIPNELTVGGHGSRVII